MRTIKQNLLILPDPAPKKTHTGLILPFIDDDVKGNEEYTIRSGTVVAVPDQGWVIRETTRHPADFKVLIPGSQRNSYYSVVEVPMEAPVKVGDRVHFDRSAIIHCDESGSKWEDDDGVEHYFIDYELIHFIVREDDIEVVGQHIILEPIPEDINDVTTDSGLLTKPFIGEQIKKGIVRWIGYDWEKSFSDLKVGSVAYYNLEKKIPIEIPGKDRDFIRLRWRNILFATDEVITDEELERRIGEDEKLKSQIEQAISQNRGLGHL